MIHFEFNSSALTPEAIELLKRIGKIMRLRSDLVVEVQGHTDQMETHDSDEDMRLAAKRAKAVVY